MLIGACGAGGTGKTTTMQALSAATKIPFIPSASRAVFARRGLVEADQATMTPHQQWELQQEIFAAREELEARTTDGIADRTLFDQVAYNLLRAPSVISKDILENLITRAKDVTIRYDHVFYFPLCEWSTAEDGMRDTAYGLRFNFDAILQTVLRYSCFEYTVVPIMTVADRVVFIRDKIRGEI